MVLTRNEIMNRIIPLLLSLSNRGIAYFTKSRTLVAIHKTLMSYFYCEVGCKHYSDMFRYDWVGFGV